MDRRSFLYATGLTGLSVAVAGCSGGDEETDDGEDGGGTETNPEQAETLIDSAGEKLDEVETKFSRQLEGFDQDNPESIETAEIEQLLDDAEADLDTARPQATEEQRERIDALDGVLEFFRGFVDAFAELSTLLEEFETADTQIQNEEWDSAVSTLERAEENVSRANTQFENARSELEGIDTTKLDESTRLEFEELESDLNELDGIFFGLDILVTSLRQFAEGFEPLDAGQTALEAENYGEAADQYATAAERYSASVETLEQGEGDVPEEFQSDLDELLCQFRAIRDAVQRFESGARLYDQGQFADGESEFQAGQDRLNESENCG